MKRNFRIAALALAAMFTVAACNNQPAEEAVDTTPVVEEVIDTTPVVEEVVAEEVEVKDEKPAKKANKPAAKKEDTKVTTTATLETQKKDAVEASKNGTLTESSNKTATTTSLGTGKKSAATATFKKE